MNTDVETPATEVAKRPSPYGEEIELVTDNEDVIEESPESELESSSEEQPEPEPIEGPRGEQIQRLMEQRAEEMGLNEGEEDEQETIQEPVPKPEPPAAPEPSPEIVAREAEIAKREAEIAKREAEFAAMQAQVGTMSGPSEDQVTGEAAPTEPPRDVMADMVDSMLSGETEEFKQHFEKAVNERFEQAIQRFQAEQEVRRINEAFAQDYPEIVADETLLKMAGNRVGELTQSGTSYLDAAAQAGSEVQAMVNRIKGVEATQESGSDPLPAPEVATSDDSSVVRRLERKQQTVHQMPTAAGRAPAVQNEADRVPSQAEQIARYRAARGQTI
jgi:hypothetical protein